MSGDPLDRRAGIVPFYSLSGRNGLEIQDDLDKIRRFLSQRTSHHYLALKGEMAKNPHRRYSFLEDNIFPLQTKKIIYQLESIYENHTARRNLPSNEQLTEIIESAYYTSKEIRTEVMIRIESQVRAAEDVNNSPDFQSNLRVSFPASLSLDIDPYTHLSGIIQTYKNWESRYNTSCRVANGKKAKEVAKMYRSNLFSLLIARIPNRDKALVPFQQELFPAKRKEVFKRLMGATFNLQKVVSDLRREFHETPIGQGGFKEVDMIVQEVVRLYSDPE